MEKITHRTEKQSESASINPNESHQPGLAHQGHGDPSAQESKTYRRFALMILISVALMHLLTFSNVAEVSHVQLSQVRIYMSLMMGAMMTIVMLLFMKSMYQNKKWNRWILIGSTVVFVLMFWMIRAQTGISDVSWMRSMIPHHSSAILTSQNADIKDPEVKKLADDIIRTQQEEIAKMRQLIQRLSTTP